MSAHILVIEDNPEMLENITSILQLAQYRVTAARNGKEGVKLAQQLRPDLILCDIMMPELDGYGVLHILHSEPETALLPFVFITAKADKKDLRHGMNLGADDYLTKPFESTDLLKMVEVRLKKKAMMETQANTPEEVSEFFSKTREIKDFQKLSENRPVRNFRKKDIIFMEGQTPNDLYFIEKGKVKTYKVNEEGKELITGIYKDGDFLGYLPLLEETASHESAEALEPCRIMLIPKGDFLKLIYSSKDVAHKFIKMLSNNLEEVENRLVNIAYQSVRQRVAGALINIGKQFNGTGKDELITVSRRDMANLVGTATESLNRTLSDFKDEGLIEIHHEGIRIANKAKLEKLIRG
ncbi:MAG: response regulator [Cyclobacteriaceae bacterium]|nr:response regulator [Cyclobacteriaceae bacterium]